MLEKSKGLNPFVQVFYSNALFLALMGYDGYTRLNPFVQVYTRLNPFVQVFYSNVNEPSGTVFSNMGLNPFVQVFYSNDGYTEEYISFSVDKS